MKTQMTTTKTFDASHGAHMGCGPYDHGHTYTVTATGPKDMDEALAAIVSELHHRNLGRMLNGGSERIDGLAAWFLERLMVTHPEVDSVSVVIEDQRATVTRERR